MNIDIFVINLSFREDRRKHTIEQLKDYSFELFDAVDGSCINVIDYGLDVFRRWIDPITKKPISNGEIGCAASHYFVWKKIASSNRPAIILEDDNKILRPLDFNLIYKYISEYDLIYLDYEEMKPELVEDIDSNLEKPYYPYWANAYVLTPSYAKRLVKTNYKENIFPVDEFFPLMNNVDFQNNGISNDPLVINNFKYLKSTIYSGPSKIAAFKDKFFRQYSRSVFKSDIEQEKNTLPSTRVLTIGTDTSKMTDLNESCLRKNIKHINIGEGVKWVGGDLSSGPGGGQKVNILFNYLKSSYIHDHDVIIFVDGYDVIINDDIDTIRERFYSFNTDIVFAAEKTCWPDVNLSSKFDKTPTGYNYLNSGCFIGYRWALLRLINNNLIDDSEDDQLFYQHRFLEQKDSFKLKVSLDTENYIFQCVSGASSDIDVLSNGQLINTSTKACPSILHGNGGKRDKEFFLSTLNKITSTITPAKQSTEVHSFFTPYMEKISVVADEIITSSFFNKEQCNKLIALAEANGKWAPMKYDNFPAQEIRIRDISIDIFNVIESYFMNVVSTYIEPHWRPLKLYGIRDLFIIKYSPETQSSLRCHLDASLVSGIVRLNDGYEGGDTYFYRQNYSNKDIPIGDIIFWPGQVTHGHEGLPVTSGVKYNLVMWTSRSEGDVNF